MVQNYKPGSVIGNHLSCIYVAVYIMPPLGLPGKHCPLYGVAPDRVYKTDLSPDHW